MSRSMRKSSSRSSKTDQKQISINLRRSQPVRRYNNIEFESDGESVTSEISTCNYKTCIKKNCESCKGIECERKTTRSSPKKLLNSTNVIHNTVSPKKQKSSESYNNCSVTPPKQKKYNTENSNKKNENDLSSPKTPSSMLLRLSLNSSPKKLPSDDSSTIRKSLWPEGDIYQSAKKALHSTTPTIMPGRQKELEELECFIKRHFEEKSSGSLYISGPPGTGKTASLTLFLDNDEKVQNGCKKVYVNCTSIKSAGAVFSRIIKELGLKATAKNEKEYLSVIEKYLLKTKKIHLIVLDEMDQLESKNQSVLYTIFEWPAKFKQNIVLIGIANALDLTDRILPRLQANCELKPELLHFAPYTKQQIVEIITSRLEQVDALKVFSPAALQMLAGKVAAVSGDVRRALDIARRVIEMIEKDSKNDVLQPIENINVSQFKTDNVKKVELKEVVGVLNNVYGTTQNLSDDCDNGFPLQQKIVICSLLLMLRKKPKDITVGKLHDTYKKICSKRNLFSVDQAEFVSLCSLIETKGILRVTGRKEPRLHKVVLEWDQEEVMAAIKDKVLISSILQDNI